MSWERAIRTGHPGSDAQAVEDLRREAASQGMALQVSPLPGGGLHVRAVPSYGGPTPSYGGPAPAGYGGPQPAFASYGGPQPAMAHAHAGGSVDNAANQLHAQASGGAAPALGSARVAYLRKVYGLLAASAALAIGAGSAVIYLSPTEMVPLDDGSSVEVPIAAAFLLHFHFLAFGLLFVATLVASWVSRVRVLNVIALFGVSALMGLELAPMAFVAQLLASRGETLTANPVRDTFVMVGGIFAALTGYVFVTKKDFSYLKATLAMGFWVVFSAAILAIFLGSEPFSLAVASVGALLSIGFLLFQTSHIFRNSRMDDAVGDALGLIVQLRNLFVFLLRIFMSRR